MCIRDRYNSNYESKLKYQKIEYQNTLSWVNAIGLHKLYLVGNVFYRELSALSIDEIQYTDLMELVMIRLQEHIVSIHNYE